MGVQPMRLLLVLLLGSLVRFLLPRLLQFLQHRPARPVWEPADPAPDNGPDAPIPFGYKNAWLVFPGATPKQVLQALSVRSSAPANWSAGMQAAGGNDQVFVTPQIDGAVLVVGLWGLLDEQRRLEQIAAHFREVQYFAAHRVTEYHGWARFLGGRPVRRYCYVGQMDRVLVDDGDMTPEEYRLGFQRFPRKNGPRVVDAPTEEDVLQLAAAWGVDPSFPGHHADRSNGYLCTL